jgi:hypothetical protein
METIRGYLKTIFSLRRHHYNADAYVKRVIGKTRKELISTQITSKSGKIDEKANRAATIANLLAEADRLSELVAEQSSSATLTARCAELTSQARKIILDPEKFDAHDALDKLDDVERRLIRADETRHLWPLFVFILCVNLIWLAVFIFLIVSKSLIPLNSGASDGMGAGILACAIWGGIGAVLDALVSLDMHVTDQDFDRRYVGWYCLHPLIGGTLGVIIYLVLQAGLATISNSTTVAGNGASAVTVGVTAFSIAVAFLAGFKQMTAIRFLSRIVKSVFQEEASTDKESS